MPVAPGSAADFAARFVGQRLTDGWGQPVIIDNRPGGAGNVGADLTAKAARDGYTLVLPITSFPVNPSLYFSTLPAAMTQVKAGKLRTPGVTSMKRVAEFPELPTVHESGLPGFDVTYWVGLFMPAGSPAAAIRRVNADTNQIMKLADTRERFSAQGLSTCGGTPVELAALLKTDIAKWAKVVKEAGIGGM